MNEESIVDIKQRLIGALVLISLGVIFIPLILNGGSHQPITVLNDNIPVMPEQLTKDLPVVPEAMMMPDPVVVNSYPERSSTLNAKDTKSPDTDDSPDSIKKPQAADKIAKTVNTKDNTYIKAVKPKTNKINRAYAIQIASFGNKKNALSLQNKLRKGGFKAYLESIMTVKGKVYRLRVGPYLKFEQVSRLRKQIEKQFKLKDTVLVQYRT